jgi:hypothetical protein
MLPSGGDWSALLPNNVPVPLTYHWVQLSDSEHWVLFRGTDKIGIYDKAKDVYQRVNTDGTLTGPAPRPWRTNPRSVPAPGVVAAKPAPAKTAEPAGPESPQVAAAETTEAAEQTAAADDAQTLPPWSIYAAGGGLTGLVLLFGLSGRGKRR